MLQWYHQVKGNEMRQTLGQYITSVRLAIDDLTDGVVDLDGMVDYADGELSLSEMRAEGITPRAAAARLLDAEGYFDFSFDSPEDLLVGYDCEGHPIGG
jgi:hypothetical protein